ncbi:MAG TPA: hypothetical protein VG815_10300 [Chloroflexota bacterium]|nr:hypothetical protein [Chloroflexota bacterium]
MNQPSWERDRIASMGWINVALGVWLVVAACEVRHASGTAMIENIATGLFVALAALWATLPFRPATRLVACRTVVLSGLWVAAPFAVAPERPHASVTPDVIVGLAIVVLGTASTLTEARRIAGRPSQH